MVYTLFGGIAALIIVHGIGRFAYTPILPLMREDGLTLQQGGWLAAANYVGYLLGALFTVFSHGDRIQRLRGGLLVSIATTLLMRCAWLSKPLGKITFAELLFSCIHFDDAGLPPKFWAAIS